MNHKLIELDTHLDTIFELREESAEQSEIRERQEKRQARKKANEGRKAEFDEYRKERRRTGKEIGTMAAGIGVGGAALGAAGATIYGVRKATKAIGSIGGGVGKAGKAVVGGVGRAGKAVTESAKKAPKAWRKRAATHRQGIAQKAAGGGKIAKARQWLNKKGGRLGKIHVLEQNLDEIIEMGKKPRTWKGTAARGAATLGVGAGLGALAGNAVNRNRRKREDWERERLVKILQDKQQVERLASLETSKQPTKTKG